jgi:hypothetical protein
VIAVQVAELLKQHGLDFHIEKVPMLGQRIVTTTEVVPVGWDETTDTAICEEREKKEIIYVPSEYFGLVNCSTNEIINTVKKGYHVSQNSDVVELVVRGMQGFSDLQVQKAGSLHGGRKTFIQLAIDGFAKVGNDRIKKYITVIDSNDGSTGLSIGIGDLTMSCSNQFFRFYKRGEMKLKHSYSLGAKLSELPSLIHIALNESLRQIEVYNRFQSTNASKSLVDGLVRELLGVDRTTFDKEIHSGKTLNSMDSLYTHIRTEMNGKGENVWGLHSGVTSWTTHEKSHPKRANGQLESIMTGTNYRTNLESFNFALGVIGATDFVLA